MNHHNGPQKTRTIHNYAKTKERSALSSHPLVWSHCAIVAFVSPASANELIAASHPPTVWKNDKNKCEVQHKLWTSETNNNEMYITHMWNKQRKVGKNEGAHKHICNNRKQNRKFDQIRHKKAQQIWPRLEKRPEQWNAKGTRAWPKNKKRRKWETESDYSITARCCSVCRMIWFCCCLLQQAARQARRLSDCSMMEWNVEAARNKRKNEKQDTWETKWRK